MDADLLVWLKSFDTRLDSHDQRLSNIEESTGTMNRELGEVVGKLKSLPSNGKINPTVALLIKYVVFPLIVGGFGVAGVKLFTPF